MNEEQRSDEVNLFEQIKVLWRYKILLLSFPLVGAVLGTLWASFMTHPTWEASAILEVGHVGQMIVEPIPNVLTRMTLPSFAKGAIKYSGIKPDELNAMQGFYGTLKATQVKGAELIEVKLRGPSAEMANSLIQGAITNLQKTHSEMMSVTLEKNLKQLQILSDDIKIATAESELMRQKLHGRHSWSDFDATLVATILKDKTNDLRALIQSKLAQEELLSPSHTYTTRVVDEVYISGGPVSPNKNLIVELAMLLGLFCAVTIAFGHNAFAAKSA